MEGGKKNLQNLQVSLWETEQFCCCLVQKGSGMPSARDWFMQMSVSSLFSSITQYAWSITSFPMFTIYYKTQLSYL